jgi:hypothetical protein
MALRFFSREKPLPEPLHLDHSINTPQMVSYHHTSIPHLPLEVILKILKYASQNPEHHTRPLRNEQVHGPYFPYTGLFICKTWSDAIKNIPEAWRSVFICFDTSYDPDLTLIRVQRHQSLCKTDDPKMHLDIYYKPSSTSNRCTCCGDNDEDNHCSFCCVRETMGSAEWWTSLRVIIAPGITMDLSYVCNRVSKAPPTGNFSPLGFLSKLAIVPHQNSPSAVVSADSFTVTNILQDGAIHDLIITNLDLSAEFPGDAPPDIVTIPHVHSLVLKNMSIQAISLLAPLGLPNLHKLIITSADGLLSDPDEDMCGLLGHTLSAVKTAMLEVQNYSLARALLSGLSNVKHLARRSQRLIRIKLRLPRINHIPPSYRLRRRSRSGQDWTSDAQVYWCATFLQGTSRILHQ